MDSETADDNVGGEVLDELLSALEDLDTKSAAILEFLKSKELATDEELTASLRQAGDASNVRWRAARLRMKTLLASAIKGAEEQFSRKIEQKERQGAPAQKPEPQEKNENVQQNMGVEAVKGAGASAAAESAPATENAPIDSTQHKADNTQTNPEPSRNKSEQEAA